MKELKNSIVKGIRDYLNCDVVPTDSDDKRPAYPFISYKIITHAPERGSGSITDEIVPSVGGVFEMDVLVTKNMQHELTLSLNTYSNDENEANTMAVKLSDWFTFAGYDYLKEKGIVAVNASAISDRAELIVDSYERRYGFDVRLRIARSISKITETIEKHNLKGKIINRKK